jgi:hypothetical protein
MTLGTSVNPWESSLSHLYVDMMKIESSSLGCDEDGLS